MLGISGSQVAVWNNQTIDASTILIKYTYADDADLDGRVNGDDYFVLDSHLSVFASTSYVHGDMNYDGKLNGDDYFLFDANLCRQVAVL